LHSIDVNKFITSFIKLNSGSAPIPFFPFSGPHFSIFAGWEPQQWRAVWQGPNFGRR